MSKNHELDLAYQFVQYTNRNIFLTGKAGTGKTTFLRSLKTRTTKRMVVVAPTGVAAINAGGVTIHSFFQLPFGPILTEAVCGRKIENTNFKQKFQKKKINIIKSLDLLVIDEISMVRADMLDAIDEILRRYKNRFQPFGGVQLLMIGDLQQLAPVVKNDEWNLLRSYYKSMFFFNAKALSSSEMVSLELIHVYRQADNHFINILNQIRDGEVTKEAYEVLSSRYIPDFNPKESEGYITLTTHNAAADRINEQHLKKLKTKTHSFKATVKGNFSEHAYPTDFDLALREGAQVMFVKNDSSPEKEYFNGKIGQIIEISKENGIVVECDGDEDNISVHKEVWENIKYSINNKTQELEEDVAGSFEQYPLRLAWAITIHKSQGLTFEKAIIDAAEAFAHGQTYVALSRCKTLEGMVLSTQIRDSAIISDGEVKVFNKNVEEHQPDDKELLRSKFNFQATLIKEIFNYKQLSSRLLRLEKIIEDNRSTVIGSLRDTLMNIQKTAMPGLIPVALKFSNQIDSILCENPDAETNKPLQERLQKAGEYFLKQHQELVINPLEKCSFESDNKKTKKLVNEGLEAIHELLHIKQGCLEVFEKKFDMEKILEVRAKAAITKTTKKASTFAESKNMETQHQDLYNMLRFWRNEQVEITQKLHYQILTQKAVIEISNKLPCTLNQLKKIHGIGKVKLQQYGDDLLEIVIDYMGENGLELSKDKSEPPKKVKNTGINPATGKSNKEISFKLYKSGKSIPDIAKEMDFVNSTIEGHLAHYVALGELEVKEFLDEKVLKTITNYFAKHSEAYLSEAKSNLPDSISWSDLKFAKAYMDFEKEKV